MSTVIETQKDVETLAWITDDEAEFWTSSTPKIKLEENNSDASKTKMDDSLTIYFKEKIAREAEEVIDHAGKTQIFEFERDMGVNENIPGIPKSFLDRLIHQITRPPAPDFDDFSDEDFTEIDWTEITAIVNENIEEESNDLKHEQSLKMKIQSFIEELGEETDVILGKIDDETLFNRRSQRNQSFGTTR